MAQRRSNKCLRFHRNGSAPHWRAGCRTPGMTILQRCQRYLKQHGVRYAHSIHAPAYTAREVASAERMPVHALAKTIVYRGDTGFGMLVLLRTVLPIYRRCADSWA